MKKRRTGHRIKPNPARVLPRAVAKASEKTLERVKPSLARVKSTVVPKEEADGLGGPGAEGGSPPPNWSTRLSASPYEHEEGYQELFAVFANTVRPQDAVEWLLLGEYVDRHWEVIELHRLKASVTHAAKEKGLGTALAYKALEPEAKNVPEKDLDPEVARFYRALRVNRDNPSNLDPYLIEAESYLARRADVDAIEKRLVRAESRRNGALREMELRRQRMAKRVAETARALMKAFLEEVERWRGVDSRIPQKRPLRLPRKRSR